MKETLWASYLYDGTDVIASVASRMLTQALVRLLGGLASEVAFVPHRRYLELTHPLKECERFVEEIILSGVKRVV